MAGGGWWSFVWSASRRREPTWTVDVAAVGLPVAGRLHSLLPCPCWLRCCGCVCCVLWAALGCVTPRRRYWLLATGVYTLYSGLYEQPVCCIILFLCVVCYCCAGLQFFLGVLTCRTAALCGCGHAFYHYIIKNIYFIFSTAHSEQQSLNRAPAAARPARGPLPACSQIRHQ